MMDLHGRSIHEIASDNRVQAAVNRIIRIREAEKTVSELSTKLMVAEQTLLGLQREMERAAL